MTEDMTPLLHPQPRRPHDLTHTSTNSSLYSPTTPSRGFSRQASDFFRRDAGLNLERGVSTNNLRSVLNLTSSTLSGIYSPFTPSTPGVETSGDQPLTPKGDGDQTPLYGIDDNKSPVTGPYQHSRLQRSLSIRSVLNLTSSTLSGIYTPSASGIETSRDQPSTPKGDGDQTLLHSVHDKRPPVIGPYTRPGLQRSHSHQPQQSFLAYILPLSLRTMLLFSFGVAYGVIVSHLHDHQQMAPVQLEGIEQSSWTYLMVWGGVGVLLGGLLPWIDVLWEEVLGRDIGIFVSKPQESRPAEASKDQGPRPASRLGSGLGADWNPVVRSVGAFIGIAFAIRRLPWQSTIQVSFTLALVNPALWYLVDRSKPGFLLSMLVGLAGTAIAFGVNPEIVPSPAASSPRASAMNISHNSGKYEGLVSNESIGVGIWIASVLFCSSVCFGNIGRRLATPPGRRP